MGGIIYFGSEKDSRLLYISAAYYCQIRSPVSESETLRLSSCDVYAVLSSATVAIISSFCRIVNCLVY